MRCLNCGAPFESSCSYCGAQLRLTVKEFEGLPVVPLWPPPTPEEMDLVKYTCGNTNEVVRRMRATAPRPMATSIPGIGQKVLT